MIPIRPWLVVGKYTDTVNSDILRDHQVGAMLQLHQAVDHLDMPTMFLPLQDGKPVTMVELDQGIDFIRRHKAQGHTVLIACSAGVSRSVTLATAALKLEEGKSLLDTFHDVRERHPRALPDQVHWQALCQYFKEDIPFWDVWRETLDS